MPSWLLDFTAPSCTVFPTRPARPHWRASSCKAAPRRPSSRPCSLRPTSRTCLVSRSSTASTAFVQALYTDLLGRQADSGGLQFWLGQVSSSGEQSVAAGLVWSFELRSDFVSQYYATLLHQVSAPSATTVNTWGTSPFDLLSLQVVFVSMSFATTMGKPTDGRPWA